MSTAPRVSEGLLISDTRSLDDLSEGVEHLAGDSDGLEEVALAGRVNDVLSGVVPVEVHHGLLEPQEVVHGADHQVDCGGVACLTSEVILPV